MSRRRQKKAPWPGPAGWRRNFLRTNQQEAVAAALRAMRGCGPRLMKGRIGALLADEVGMGKTWEALAASAIYLAACKRREKALFLVPPGLRQKWRDEIKDFCEKAKKCGRKPGKRMAEVLRDMEKASNKELGDSPGRIILWPTSRAKALFQKHRNNKLSILVLDEAHKARKRTTKLSEALEDIRKHNRHCPFLFLSATPFQCDRHSELPHLLSFLDSNYNRDEPYDPHVKLKTQVNEVERPESLVDYIALGLNYIDEQLKDLFKTSDPLQIKKGLHDLIVELDKNIDLPIDRGNKTFNTETGNNAQDGLDEYLRAFIIRTPKPAIKYKPSILDIKSADAALYLFGRAYLRQDSHAKDNPYALDPPPGGKFLPNGYSRLCSAHAALDMTGKSREKPHAHRSLLNRISPGEGESGLFSNFSHPKLLALIKILENLADAKGNKSGPKAVVFFNHLKTIKRAHKALLKNKQIKKILTARALIGGRKKITKSIGKKAKTLIHESGLLKKLRTENSKLKVFAPLEESESANEIEALEQVFIRGLARFNGKDRNALIEFWGKRITALIKKCSPDGQHAGWLRRQIRGLLSNPKGKPSRRKLDASIRFKPFRIVESFSGKDSYDRRVKMLDCFNHPGIPPFILLLSQVGAEGLDMQKACKTVIHHDLHWNPTVLEQREGRVYRDNVKAKDVHVEALHYVLGYDYTIQKYAKHREAYKDFLLGETRFGEFLEAIVDEQGVESIDRNLYKPKQKGHWHIDLKPPALMPA